MTATAISSAGEQREREMKDHQVRVVIADDSVLLREGIARLLEESGFEVVGQAGDAEDLLRKVGAHKPDIAVVDVRMPPTHTDEGLRAAHRIRAEYPDTAVLVLSQYVEEAYALDLLSESTEGTGYLLKDRVADVGTFTDAVRRVAKGGSALDPEVVALMLGRRHREDPLATLTPREHEVLGLMAEGARTPRWRRRSWSASARWRSTSPRSSPSSTCRRRRRTIGECWRC
jgi:DNA-binding NarL/FixJ family response regulator